MLDTAKPLSSVQLPAKEYDAIFSPGCQGPLIGLPENADSSKVTRTFFEDGRIVAAICHARAVLTEVRLSDGSNLVEGRKVTRMSNKEEQAWGRVDYVPFLVQTRLGERGGEFIEGKQLWGEHVVVDRDSQGRTLITGANPSSGSRLAEEIIKAIGSTE